LNSAGVPKKCFETNSIKEKGGEMKVTESRKLTRGERREQKKLKMQRLKKQKRFYEKEASS